MSTDLLLTLGHNSSAIRIDNGILHSGYEQERLTRVKGDSSFPLEAIEECGDVNYDNIYITHWSPTGRLEDMSRKYWKPHLLPVYENIYSHTVNLTHHDCHAFSARAFDPAPAHTLVVDGFGNYGETLSFYGPNMELLDRVRGYYSSLGLMYQYATTAMGLKANQDEFKLLGYEVLLSRSDQDGCESHIANLVNEGLRLLSVPPSLNKEDDPLHDLAALVRVQQYWHDEFNRYYGSKPHIAYVAQSVLERVLCAYVDKWPIRNLRLAGGVFMNVKLTMKIREHIGAYTSVMPLSGDQGVALGMYNYYHPNWEMPSHLYWGKRPPYTKILDIRRLLYYPDKESFGSAVEKLLAQNKIVNVICGDMEFGPRALCNTSTLAQPLKKNADYINRINGRDSVMPMGPVVNVDIADDLFGVPTAGNTDMYMATAFRLKHQPRGIEGVIHVQPKGHVFTSRPQLMEYTNHPLYEVIFKYGILINTSFNTHGTPIVWDHASIIEAHEDQLTRDPDGRVYTLILDDNNEQSLLTGSRFQQENPEHRPTTDWTPVT